MKNSSQFYLPIFTKVNMKKLFFKAKINQKNFSYFINHFGLTSMKLYNDLSLRQNLEKKGILSWLQKEMQRRCSLHKKDKGLIKAFTYEYFTQSNSFFEKSCTNIHTHTHIYIYTKNIWIINRAFVTWWLWSQAWFWGKNIITKTKGNPKSTFPFNQILLVVLSYCGNTKWKFILLV